MRPYSPALQEALDRVAGVVVEGQDFEDMFGNKITNDDLRLLLAALEQPQ